MKMRGRITKWSAWGMWTLTVLAIVLTLVLVMRNGTGAYFWEKVLLSLVVLAFSTVGAFVTSRRPENAIGWLFCAGALVWILGELALEYGVYALITARGALPVGAWMVWFGGWARGMGWFLITAFLLLFFPTGRLPSPRWRPVAWSAIGFLAAFTIVAWLSPTSIDLRFPFLDNPLGLEFEIMDLLGTVINLAFLPLVMASGMAVIVRFRRSQGDERQQIKWFAYAVVLMVSVFVLWYSLGLLGLASSGVLTFTVPLIGLPVAVGIAILRYRLYDIDLIIRKTLVYTALSAVLALVFFGSVTLMQSAFSAVSGQQSAVATVLSTLAIAALFNPLRRRIQTLIDRRFYRRKYDAHQVLAGFAKTARDEVSLEALRDEMLRVVEETMQPEGVWVWLKLAAGEENRTGRIRAK